MQPTPSVSQRLASVPASNARNGREERRQGKVKCWFADRGFGFVVEEQTGEEFHLTARALIYQEDLQHVSKDVRVAFVAQKAPAPGKNRRVGSLLPVGHDAEGTLVSLPSMKAYGWIRVQDALGNNSHLVHVYLNDNPAHYKVGDLLSFQVGANDKGTYAVDVARAEADAVA